MTQGFVFDQRKCTGCQACMLACTIENQLPFGRSWRSVYSFNNRHIPNLPVVHLSMACNHCETPACLHACPASAYDRDPKTGLVIVDGSKCMGCKYCTWACPFDAPHFDDAAGTVEKCTFCSERQSKGLQPACVELCPTGALSVGERKSDVYGEAVIGLSARHLDPGIDIVPIDSTRKGPEVTAAEPTKEGGVQHLKPSSHFLLEKEWPLVAFTFLVTLLVAVQVSSVLGGATLDPLVFLSGAAVATLFSSIHLGRKSRAIRAIHNLKRSWLSREIFSFAAFIAVGFTHTILLPDNSIFGFFAAALGIATLISIDMVYGTLPTTKPTLSHSAGVSISAILILGISLANPYVSGLAGIAKLLLYLRRKQMYYREGLSFSRTVAGFRISVGLVLPAVLWSVEFSYGMTIVLAAVLVGELIDRSEFYLELDIVNPKTQMASELILRTQK